jgi:multidrug efflux system outer membrane protein
MNKLRLLMAAAPLALSACALTAPPASVTPALPAQWHAPLPHQGQLGDLSQWWRGQGDPLLAQLIDAAQQVSPSIATAQSRIAQSRADRVAASAALLPSLDASASVTRASQQSTLPSGTTTQLALQSSWELDLFGGRRAGRNAAQARLAGAEAQWHEARVSVAAEVANQYYSLRACEQLLAVAVADAASRSDSARLTKLSADAGFQAPATSALASASAAEGSGRATGQRALCELDIKALTALTGLDEPALRARLASATAVAAPPLGISSVPAELLAQRPDVFNAEREVAAASADVGAARAQRYPRLALQGSVGLANFRSGGDNIALDTWSIGPLALTLPIFNGGRLSANVDAASARYEAAVVNYRASARQAVREVEQALVNLDSSTARIEDAKVAMQGYRLAFQAAEDRYKNGMASLLELEETRRLRLAAENAAATLQRERNQAWVALYRAAGGGWTRPAAN